MMVVNPADNTWKPTNVSGVIAFCFDKENNTKSIRMYSPPVRKFIKEVIGIFFNACFKTWILGLKQDLDEKASYAEESPTFHIVQKGVN
jgi:hypothetical protein